MARRPAVPAPDADAIVRAMLALSAGKPCPTNREIASALGITEHAVRLALLSLARTRLIRAQRTGQRGACSRRIRVSINGQWTAWTQWTARAKPQQADHLALVLKSGSYQDDNSSNDLTSKAVLFGDLANAS